MDTIEAREAAQAFIGGGFIATAVQVRGDNYYVSYRPVMGDSQSLGGGMPVEVNPETGKCRHISIDEVFELDL
ncbi:hypothetical protein ACFWBI_39765 [Streptomyces sp. NPDC059982]|uniref:hypothetical protein n=1 Tax=unclassified Streptomyces TaxID=2593676 RepID=UPI003680365F